MRPLTLAAAGLSRASSNTFWTVRQREKGRLDSSRLHAWKRLSSTASQAVRRRLSPPDPRWRRRQLQISDLDKAVPSLQRACKFSVSVGIRTMSGCTLLLLWLASTALVAAKDAAALGPALGRGNTLRRALQQAPPAPQAACNSSQSLEWVVQPYAPITMCRGGSLQLTWTGLCGASGRTRCMPCRQLLHCSDPCGRSEHACTAPDGCSPLAARLTREGGPSPSSIRFCLTRRLYLYPAGLSLMSPSAGIHTVVLVPGPYCPDEWTAPGIVTLAPLGYAPPSGGSYTATLNNTGTLFFACSYSTHCVSGGRACKAHGPAGQAHLHAGGSERAGRACRSTRRANPCTLTARWTLAPLQGSISW